jgi:hypothetical protein
MSLALLVNEDFVLMTATNKIPPAQLIDRRQIAAMPHEPAIFADCGRGLVKRGGGRGAVADHIAASVYSPWVF